MLTDDTHVIMTASEFKGLLEYSCSLPTGVLIGKRWKRNLHAFCAPGTPPRWLMGEYEEDDEPGYVRIRWREILEAVPDH
jgi:hypothetical protein